MRCNQCAHEFYQAQRGQTECQPKQLCGIGFGSISHGTASSDRECAPCISVAEGHFPRDSGGTWSGALDNKTCAPVTTCKDSEYETSKPTAASDRKCLPHSLTCPTGQYSFAAPTAAHDRICRNVSICVAGRYQAALETASSDRLCIDCQAGRFQNASDQTACIACQPGQFRNESIPAFSSGDVACVGCAAGRYPPKFGKKELELGGVSTGRCRRWYTSFISKPCQTCL